LECYLTNFVQSLRWNLYKSEIEDGHQLTITSNILILFYLPETTKPSENECALDRSF